MKEVRRVYLSGHCAYNFVCVLYLFYVNGAEKYKERIIYYTVHWIIKE